MLKSGSSEHNNEVNTHNFVFTKEFIKNSKRFDRTSQAALAFCYIQRVLLLVFRPNHVSYIVTVLELVLVILMLIKATYRTCDQTLLPVIMFNYHICLYNNVCERNGNTICLNQTHCVFNFD